MGNRFYDGQPGPEIRRSLNELEDVFDEAILNAKGPQGWAPVLAGAIDGARRVHQVVDWTGGEGDKPTALGYIGAAGIVADVADAVDVRGPQGAAGADGADGTNGADGAQGPDGPQGQSGADGSDGADGNDGWTAVLANVADGARIVQQVVDWVGGQGAKPATGKYVGPTGLVDTAAEAVNVRGPAGSGSGDVTGPASSTDGHVALFDGATGKALKGGGALGTAAAQNVEYFASAAEGALALTSLQPDDVAAVATSGAYADLSGRPTIPAAQQQTDWNAPSGVTAIANKPVVIAAGATQAEARTAIGAGTSNLADAPSDGKTYGRMDAAWVEAGGAGRDAGTQLYTTSQSIPKSTFGTASYVFVELWGGGGSGQAVCTTNSGQSAPGGEGGEYASALIYVSSLSTSTALVVGSGGASVTATSTTPVVGNNGGDSSFAGLTALGGLGAAAAAYGPAKNWLAGKTGGEGGGASPYSFPTSTERVASGPGGSSVMGGGGGGGGGDQVAYSPAGTSQFAGNGGTGVFSAVSPLTGNNGGIPSGGGSGTRLNRNSGTATSGAGARGQARLTWW